MGFYSTCRKCGKKVPDSGFGMEFTTCDECKKKEISKKVLPEIKVSGAAQIEYGHKLIHFAVLHEEDFKEVI